MDISDIQVPDRSILLVDDEVNIITSLQRVLRIDGYKIHTANSGAQALDVLRANPVEVIISDQRMPNMTGSEFLNHAKDLCPDTVRIMLSGYTDLESITDAINRGSIFRFLTKPWDPDLLRQNVIEAFEYYELKSVNEQLSRKLKVACKELVWANSELEHHVEEKNRESRLKSHILNLSRDLLEDIPVGVIGLARTLQISVSNKKAVELLGKPRQDVDGCYATEVFSDSLMACLKQMLANVDGADTVTYKSIMVGDFSLSITIKINNRGSNSERIIILFWCDMEAIDVIGI